MPSRNNSHSGDTPSRWKTKVHVLREKIANSTPLAGLGHGVRAQVVDIDSATPQLIARLAARGLMPGASLEILRGGDPMLVMIEDSRWALTREDAVHILVSPTHLPLRSRLRALFA
jgi:Fe2+ transport system protein FeoA